MNINAICAKLDKARKQVQDLEAKLNEAVSAETKKVQVVKNAQSITLVYGGRKINARRNAYGRLTVKEGRQVLFVDYMSNVRQLKFDLATGAI